MHSYMRAVGFGTSINGEQEVDILLDRVCQKYETRRVVRLGEENRYFLEMTKACGPNVGLCVCGELDEEGFHRQYYFPYLRGSGDTCGGEVTVEKRVSGHSYEGVCEDGRVGVSLIFYLQNPGDFRRETEQQHLRAAHVTTTLSALSLHGVILLPQKTRETSDRSDRKREDYFTQRSAMVRAAKNGNQDAIESLTLEDMDLYTMLARRTGREDILSIVDTSFMPYGMECDQYKIIGTIQFYTQAANSITGEMLWQLTVECCGMTFDVCINQRDLMGEPEVGRRFKGTIWLQGRLNYPE